VQGGELIRGPKKEAFVPDRQGGSKGGGRTKKYIFELLKKTETLKVNSLSPPSSLLERRAYQDLRIQGEIQRTLGLWVICPKKKGKKRSSCLEEESTSKRRKSRRHLAVRSAQLKKTGKGEECGAIEKREVKPTSPRDCGITACRKLTRKVWGKFQENSNGEP